MLKKKKKEALQIRNDKECSNTNDNGDYASVRK